MPKDLRTFTVLGLETSCDETAAAIVRGRSAGAGEILSNIVFSQFEDHAAFGGVVPEIAARAHVERVDLVIAQALEHAKMTMADIDAVAVTAGPGLIGGVMVGLTTAKAICLSHDLPLIPVNHLEAHALTVRLGEDVAFPYLLLLVSGGHTQLLIVKGIGSYQRLGTTIDDAAGEVFDKTAQLLGLPNPGGPNLEKLAVQGDAEKYKMPRPLLQHPGCDFSFSGMKTATRLLVEEFGNSDTARADIAASFQKAAAAHLAARTERAMIALEDTMTEPLVLVIAGGVAANQEVHRQLLAIGKTHGWRLVVPPPKLCTDNGAMVAWAGLEYLASDRVMPREQALAIIAKPRWPLDENPAGIRHGGGKKGPKA